MAMILENTEKILAKEGEQTAASDPLTPKVLENTEKLLSALQGHKQAPDQYLTSLLHFHTFSTTHTNHTVHFSII